MKIDRLDPIALLDCRNIKMRFDVTCTSTDSGICLANLAYPFQSVRVLCGTKVVVDINNAALLNSILYNSMQNSTISAFEQSITVDTDLTTKQAAADGVKEYMIYYVSSQYFSQRRASVGLEQHGRFDFGVSHNTQQSISFQSC